MSNPLLLPPRLLLRALDDLHAIARAAERLPTIERELFRRLDSLEREIAALPQAIEHVLREHFERQVESIQRLHPELVANKENSGDVPPLIEALGERIDALRAEMASIRETLEPLQASAERIDRLTDRIPGTS